MVFACSEASYSDVLDGPGLGSRGLSKPGQSCFSRPYFPYLWRAKGGLLSSLKILLWLNKRMMRQVNEKKRKELRVVKWRSCSVIWLCDPMDCSTPGFPVLYCLPEFAQTHVHWVNDAIQPSHLLPPSLPALSLSQHQGLFQWVSCSHQVAKVLELQHQSFQE